MLQTILKNVQVAETEKNLVCQDTGLAVYYCSVGEHFPLHPARIYAALPGAELTVTDVGLNPRRTALILCDMWDDHWCKSAARRVTEMAGPMNAVVKAARARGLALPDVHHFEAVPGHGLKVHVGQRSVLIGNRKLLIDYSISGKLDHSFVFPFNPDADVILPFIAIELRGKDKVRVSPRVMIAEDFSYFQEQVPGVFFFVGVTPLDVRAARAAGMPVVRYDCRCAQTCSRPVCQ